MIAVRSKARYSHYARTLDVRQKVRGARERARLHGQPDGYTPTQFRKAIAAFRDRCAYCGVRFTETNLPTIEHFIPVSAYGAPGTVASNIIPACITCNGSKNGSPAKAWLVTTFGAEHAAIALANIQTYFLSLGEMTTMTHQLTDMTPAEVNLIMLLRKGDAHAAITALVEMLPTRSAEPQPAPVTSAPQSTPDFTIGGKLLEVSVEPIMGTPSKACQLSITLFNRWNVWVSGWISFCDFRRK